LNEIRFAEVIFLLHQAEEESDAEKYLTGLKFANLLFATTNATKYVHMSSELFKWWECASDAAKELFKKVIITKKTKDGNTIYTDRFFEWFIKAMRETVGKFYRAGSDNKVIKQALLLNLKQQFTSVFKSEIGKSDTRDKNSLKECKVFCETVAAFDEFNLWTDEDTKRIKLTKKSEDMNVDAIDAPQIGESRMASYMTAKFGAGLSCSQYANRDEDEMNVSGLLKTINPTMKKQNEDDKIEVDRSTATLQSAVEKYYSKSELVSEWSKVVSLFKDEGWTDDLPKMINTNKPDYAMAICQAREFIKRKDLTWMSRTQSAVKDAIKRRKEDAVASMNDKISNAKNSLFFKLTIDDDMQQSYSTAYNIGDNNIDAQQSQASCGSQDSFGAGYLEGL
jgi:hypothetical protein